MGSQVIFIDCHIDDVVATLEADTGAQAHRASLGEHPRVGHVTCQMPWS